MALVRTLNGDIVHVREIIHGCTKDHVQDWYFDTRNWLCSSHGCEGDTPDRPMTSEAIEWTKRHHLPNAVVAKNPA